MLNRLVSKRILLDWPPAGAALAGLLALAWWLLQWPLQRHLRTALGGAAAAPPSDEPPIRPRRPKNRARRGYPRLPYPTAA